MAPSAPTPTRSRPAAGDVLSHYRLLEKIGQGGMGVVWKAEDTLLGRTVAVKLLRPGLRRDGRRREMFLEEARLASSLSAPHIAQVYDFVQQGERDFIVMEYVPGEPLSRILEKGPLPPATVARWGAQVARGLARAHAKGLLHRDIKPANILITPDDDVKLVDFGVAALAPSPEPLAGVDPASSHAETLESAPRSGDGPTIAGTVPYMSPEQLRGEEVESRSDVFSLGAALYEMTTGQQPFGGRSSVDLVASILEARPRPPHEIVPQVPAALERILERALSRLPANRHASMEDLADELERLGRALETGTARPHRPRRPRRSGRGRVRMRHFGIPALATVAIVLLVALGSWLGGLFGPPAPVVDGRTILVYPMEVRGQTEGARYAGRAFAEAVAIQLAQYPELRILPVPSPGELGEGASLDLAGAARGLGAGLVLSGSLTRGPEVVQASLTMIDAAENRILWGLQREDRDGDLARLARAVVQEGVTRLGSLPPPPMSAPMEVSSGSALAASPDASAATASLRRNAVNDALEATRKLTHAHPSDADALLLHVTALLRQWCSIPTPPNRQALLEGLTDLARVAPDNPFRWIRLEGVPGGQREVIQVLTDVLHRDTLPLAYRAEVLRGRAWARRNLAEYDAALEDLSEALRVEPADPLNLSTLAYFLQEVGRPEEAIGYARNAVSLNPHDWFFHHSAGMVLADLHKYDEAAKSFGEACRLARSQRPCAALAIVLLDTGEEQRALETIRKVEAMPMTLNGAYNLGCFWARAGDPGAALRYLRIAVDMGLASRWMMLDSDLDSLHDLPEFQALVEEVEAKLEPEEPEA